MWLAKLCARACGNLPLTERSDMRKLDRSGATGSTPCTRPADWICDRFSAVNCAAAPESRCVHSNHSARDPSIAERIVDVHIVDDGGVVPEDAAAESAIEAPSPPGMEHFKRRQRHPAHSAKSKADAKPKPPPKPKNPT